MWELSGIKKASKLYRFEAIADNFKGQPQGIAPTNY